MWSVCVREFGVGGWTAVFASQMEKARREGRLHPDLATAAGYEPSLYTCPICGMWHRAKRSSLKCCSSLVPATDEQRKMSNYW